MIPRYPEAESWQSTSCSCPISAIVSKSFMRRVIGWEWKVDTISATAGTATLSLGVQLARDDDSLNLRGALVDLRHLRVAEQPFDGVVLHVSIAAEDLDRLRRDRGCGLAGGVLGQQAELGDPFSAIFRRRGRVQ